MIDFLIQNVRIYTGRGTAQGNIAVQDGRFLFVGGEREVPARKVINASGLCAAPGLVDMHVHLRDFGQSAKETIATGCRAAAAGGVTSLAAMPNTLPPVDSPEQVAEVLRRAQSAPARVYPVAAVTQGMKGEVLNDFSALKAAGAAAFSEDGRPVASAKLMADAMAKAQRLEMPLLSHCEDLSLTAGGIIHEGEISRALGVKGVPAASENAATARDIALAASYGLSVHVCHVSTAVSLRMIRAAKRDGVKVTCETAPHYFTFTDGELMRKNADFRMSPPLRTEADRLAVIEGLRDGTIDAIATDHAPHTPQEKSDFCTAPNGVAGLETSLAASITALVKPGYITLEKLIELMSTAPASILDIPGGRLAEGEKADLVLFDPDEEWTVDRERLHGKSQNTPFHGKTLTGRVHATLCRGRLVYQDGVICND